MSELEKETGGRVACQNLDATTPENKAIVKELGFGNHGLVIRSADGETLWSQPDHEVDMVKVRSSVNDLLGS